MEKHSIKNNMYLISISLAKLLNFIINTLKLGAGFTWPGHLALTLYPNLLKNPQLFPAKGIMYVSATNGKTTTTKMISHILKKHGMSVVTNTSGANLLNGIASALLLNTTFAGTSLAEYGVFEVDEFTLPLLLREHRPNILALLNLSRDQLDRYGETDTILDRWIASVNELAPTTHLILDSTQEKLVPLAKAFKGDVAHFDASPHACANPDLSGVFNTKNVNAALIVVSHLGIENSTALSYLDDFKFAWGRGEKIEKNGLTWRIMLAKNPASFNSNLDAIVDSSSDVANYKVALFILNDNIPDGRDVSWIYDVDPARLSAMCKDRLIYVAGTRAYDMAVRLSYADVSVPFSNISRDTKKLIERLKKDLACDGNLDKILVLPNYSAMLQFRNIMLGRSIL